MKKQVVYIVRAEENPYIFEDFLNIEDAVNFAKKNIEDKTTIDKIEQELDDFGSVSKESDSVRVWSYDSQRLEDKQAKDDLLARVTQAETEDKIAEAKEIVGMALDDDLITEDEYFSLLNSLKPKDLDDPETIDLDLEDLGWLDESFEWAIRGEFDAYDSRKSGLKPGDTIKLVDDLYYSNLDDFLDCFEYSKKIYAQMNWKEIDECIEQMEKDGWKVVKNSRTTPDVFLPKGTLLEYIKNETFWVITGNERWDLDICSDIPFEFELVSRSKTN